MSDCEFGVAFVRLCLLVLLLFGVIGIFLVSGFVVVRFNVGVLFLSWL